MGDWKPKYRWARTWGDETGIDGKRHDDWTALDGKQFAGRIRLESAGPTKDLWQWAGALPPGRRNDLPLMPNMGWVKTAAEAGRLVEDYWDKSKGVQ